MRFHFVVTVAALLGLAACASSQTPASAPGMSNAPAAGETAQALPRYFAVTVSSGGLQALGQPLDGEQLKEWASREARDPNVAGAAVTAEAGASETDAVNVIAVLVHSGFKHVVFSSREGLSPDAAPVSSSAPPVAMEAAPEVATGEQEPEPAPRATAPAPPAEALPKVEVKQLGLHIGGGPNTEEAHAVYAQPIQRRFGELQQCYALATGTQKNASFGVDLLISTRGGTAKIKDYRTALGGKEFHLCVLGVFGTVEFPPRDKATMVSYSVLFKPL